MTTLTAMTLLTLAMTFALVPKRYWSLINSEQPSLEQESMKSLLEQRAWVLQHLRCSIGALVLLWLSKVAVEVPRPLDAAIAIYASSSLLLVILESLLAQKIDCMLAKVEGVK